MDNNSAPVFSSETYLKYLTTQMPWPIMICDEDQGIIDANPAVESLFQRTSSELLGHNITEYLVITEEELKLSPFATTRRLLLPNVESLLVALLQTPLDIAPGKKIIFTVIMDMSLALGMQQEQLRSAELVGIFQTIATVNHELNNPLFGLMATLQLLTEEMKDADPAFVRKLARMTECSERIKQISDNLSQVVRPARRIYAANEDMLDLERALGSNEK